MADTFTLAELTASEQSFRAVEPEPPVAAEVETIEETPPVALETDSPTETGDVVDPADSTPPAADETAAPPKGSARERIEDLVAERNALKKYIEYRDSLEQRPPVAAAPPVAAPVEASEPPTLESCQYDTDKWTKAMNAWTKTQIQTGVKQALSAEKQNANTETVNAKFEERMDAYVKANPKVKEALGNPALPKLSPDAAALIVASEWGPQIVGHLGMNPDKAVRISRQSPMQQAAAIGRLEVELKVQPKTSKQISNAPVPPTPNRGAVTPQEGGTIADFVARERKAMAERRRRV